MMPEGTAWPAAVGAWVIVSLVLYVVGGWGWWALRRTPWGDEIQWSAWGYALRWLLRLAHLAVIPYLALIFGVASPRLLGLTDINWLDSLSSGGGLALLALALWMIAIWTVQRVLPRARDDDEPSVSLRALEAVALQFHWAFYRSLTLLWLDDPYWSVWGGIALIGLQGALGLSLWQRGWTPARVERLVGNSVLLVVTTALFFYTRNLWLGIAFHGIAACLQWYRLAHPAGRARDWALDG